MHDAGSLLVPCVARLDVLVNNVPARRGTAFFVAPGVALTTAHTIVDAQGALLGRLALYYNGKLYDATPRAPILTPPYPDIAALSVANIGAHPYATLGDGMFLRPGDAAYSYGFKVDAAVKTPVAESMIFKVQGRAQRWEDAEGLSPGQFFIGLSQEMVVPGSSGAPILCLRSMTVCAILKWTRNSTAALGGLSVPINEALKGIPNLLETALEPSSGRHLGQVLFNIAEIHSKAGRVSEAAKAYRSAAEVGHAGAQVKLGYFYERGLYDFPKDLRKARSYYEAATQQGYPPAQYNLGVFYHRGIADLPRSTADAARMYRLAANQEYAPALVALAKLILKGAGDTPLGDHPAVPLLQQAANQGDPEASYYLGLFYEHGRGGLDPDKGRARTYFSVAASGGHLGAQEKLISSSE